MTEHLTFEDVQASAKRVITGHEDFEYEPIDSNCVYFVPVMGECDCGSTTNEYGEEWHHDECTLGCTVEVLYDQPSCVVGHMLVDLNLAHMVKPCNNSEGISEVANVLAAEGVELDHEAEVFLTHLQCLQDRKTPWGPALETAATAARNAERAPDVHFEK